MEKLKVRLKKDYVPTLSEPFPVNSDDSGFLLESDRRKPRLAAAGNGKGGGKKDQPCGACILVIVLAGDLSIVQAYFYKMIGKGWFQNIRKFYGSEIETFVSDLCSEVLETLFSIYINGNLSRIKKVKSYIWNTVRYICIDEERRLRRLMYNLSLFEKDSETIENALYLGVEESAEQDFIRMEELEVVRKVVSELLPFERYLVCLRYYEELSYAEIAAIIGESSNYVGVMLFHLRRKIKKKLVELLPTE